MTMKTKKPNPAPLVDKTEAIDFLHLGLVCRYTQNFLIDTHAMLHEIIHDAPEEKRTAELLMAIETNIVAILKHNKIYVREPQPEPEPENPPF